MQRNQNGETFHLLAASFVNFYYFHLLKFNIDYILTMVFLLLSASFVFMLFFVNTRLDERSRIDSHVLYLFQNGLADIKECTTCSNF